MANNKQKVEEILKRLTEDNKGKEGFYGIDTLTIAEVRVKKKCCKSVSK